VSLPYEGLHGASGFTPVLFGLRDDVRLISLLPLDHTMRAIASASTAPFVDL
jgi:hypothetical protein